MRYAVPVSGGVLTAGDNICDHQVENRLLSEDSGPPAFLWYGARFTYSSSNGLRPVIDISSVLIVVVIVGMLRMVIRSL